MTAGTLVPAAEGIPVEEAETEKVALTPGAGAGLEEAKTDTGATEAIDGDRSQLEETEAAATQVRVLVSEVSWEVVATGTLCWLMMIPFFGVMDGL